MGADRQTVDYQTDSIDTAGVISPQNRADARSSGVYVQEKISWGDWVLRGGMRRNSIVHHYAMLGGVTPAMTSASWSKDLWSLGARYNHSPDFSVYANAGTSFMPPTAKQIGGTLLLPGDSGQVPNPALQPEAGMGQDLGMDWRINPALTFGARGFVNRVTAAIVDNVVSVAPSQTKASNAGSATARGVELDLKHSASDDTQWFANLTATRTRIENPVSADQNGTEIPFAPDQVANLGTTTHVAAVTVSAYYQWVGQYWDSASRSGRSHFGNYGLVNMRLQRELMHDAASRVSVFLDFNNLTNRRFDMPWGFRDPGLNAYAGLNATF
jgi:iron complex outermembrane receptor protein